MWNFSIGSVGKWVSKQWKCVDDNNDKRSFALWWPALTDWFYCRGSIPVNYPFNKISKSFVSWLLVLICPKQHWLGLWIMSQSMSHLLTVSREQRDSKLLLTFHRSTGRTRRTRRKTQDEQRRSSLTFLHSSASLNISRSSSGLSPELSSSSPTPSSRISSAGRQHGRLHLGLRGAKYQEAWRIFLFSPLIKIQVRL